MKQDKRLLVILIGALAAMILTLCGCQEEQRKVWGTGELKADWTEFFGDDNGSRLDFVQTQRINGHNEALLELIKRVQALESENPAELAERVRKLEDAATAQALRCIWRSTECNAAKL